MKASLRSALLEEVQQLREYEQKAKRNLYLSSSPGTFKEEAKASESEERRDDVANVLAPEEISALRIQCLEAKNNYLSTLEEYNAVEADIEVLKEEKKRNELTAHLGQTIKGKLKEEANKIDRKMEEKGERITEIGS